MVWSWFVNEFWEDLTMQSNPDYSQTAFFVNELFFGVGPF